MCDPQIEGLPKSAVSVDLPLCCNSFFSKNTRLNSSTQFSLRNFDLYSSTPSKNWWLCALCSKPDGPKFPTSVIILYRPWCSNSFLSEQLLVWSLLPGPELKTSHSERKISLKNHSFSSICQVPDHPKLPDKKLDLSRSSIFFFSKTTALISSNKSSIESFNFVRRFP